MPAMYEADQVGKRESLADIIANVEAIATPFTSMLAKRKKPLQVLHDWQVKAYPVTGHQGVVDGKDADDFQSNPRKRISAVSQKTWYNPAVSDFADEAVVAGESRGEMAAQVADALVTVKRQIEKRCLSNDDCQLDDGNIGNETRGAFKWVDSSAQSLYPVPADFRTPSTSIHSDTLANCTEEVFKGLMASAYKERHAPSKLDGFCGVELKTHISKWGSYQDDVASKTPVRVFNQDAGSRALLEVIDRLVFDTGQVDLHLTSFNWTDPTDGSDSAYTDKSGLFLDMSMWGLAYTRMPRVVKLPYKGGGKKAIVDAIFLLMADNVLGSVAVKSSS